MDWNIDVPSGFYRGYPIAAVAALIAIVVLWVRSWFAPKRPARGSGRRKRR